MPRDLHRLAAPAVFCDNVRRSVRRFSPRRNVARQQDRLRDDRHGSSNYRDRESEYDDYAAEIASYNRLRSRDRNVANSYASVSRHANESLSYYDNSANLMPAQIDARYFTSRFRADDYLHVDVPAHHRTSHISDNYDRPSISRLDRDDSQQKRHKRKRKHHHCHSQNKTEKHSANSSSSHPPRDTVAALKALADYGDTNYDMPSASPEHHYVSPRKFERRLSHKRRGSAARDSVGSAVIAKTVKPGLKVTVNAECTRDDLSLGECTDDEDEVTVGIRITQKSAWSDHQKSPSGDYQKSPSSGQKSDHKKSPPSDHSLSHVEQSEYCGKSSTDTSVCLSSAVLSSSKKHQTGGVSYVSEDSSIQSCDISNNSRLSNATSSSESKIAKEQLPIKHDKDSSNHSKGQSVDYLKHSPVSKENSVVDDDSKTVPDKKHSTEETDKPSESTQNSTKKSATGDNKEQAEDDSCLPRFVM